MARSPSSAESRVSSSGSLPLSKDQLVLAMLAVLGGEARDVSERDLFLACWHAFPNAMRWADTALPNPDTFTASLRRLDADSLIVRAGKQMRGRAKKPARRDALDIGRSGIVKARIKTGALVRAGVAASQIEEVRRLAMPPESYRAVDPAILVSICLGARQAEGRITDEGSLLEAAFHMFPAAFAYKYRSEFPDPEAVRAGLARARAHGLVGEDLTLTDLGRREIGRLSVALTVRTDPSTSHSTGAFRVAERIRSTPGYAAFERSGSVAATKGDELFRALRVPPTTDSARIAASLLAHSRELRRIDQGKVVEYLLNLAALHNPDVLPLISAEEPLAARVSVADRGGSRV